MAAQRHGFDNGKNDNSRGSRKVYLFGALAALFLGLAFVLTGIAALQYLGYRILPVATLSSAGQEQAASNDLRVLLDILINAIGVLASVGVSLALAAIYVSQNNILNEQTEIQKRQSRLERRQFIPDLTVHPDGVNLHDGRPTLESSPDDASLEIETSGDKPWVSIAIENHGDETVQQLQLACLVSLPNDESETSLFPGVCELNVDGMITRPPKGQGALLPPRPGVSLLSGRPQFSDSPDGEGNFELFRQSIKTQLQKCEQEVIFGFVLIFSNSINQRFAIHLDSAYLAKPAAFESESVDMESLVENSVSYDIDELVSELDWNIPKHAFQDVTEL